MSDPVVLVEPAEFCISLDLEQVGSFASPRIVFAGAKQFVDVAGHMVDPGGECCAGCPQCTVERGSGAFRVTR